MKLDVFIAGENVDLCIPNKEFAEKSQWYSWFNDSSVTKYLYQGSMPNNHSQQVEFYESQKNNRLLLIISNRKDYMGVISLSCIDLARKHAAVALVVNSKIDKMNSPMISLESIAMITEHAFLVMGMNRVWAGQHQGLSGWQQRMELLGYRVEGIQQDAFVKGRSVADVILIAARHEDYRRIKEKRGKYWDSTETMKKRIKKLPKVKFIEQLYGFFEKSGGDYYDNILTF